MRVFDLSTDRSGLFEITDTVRQAVKESGCETGAVLVFIPHTTAGVTIISRMDELGFCDIEEEFDRLIPTRIDFKHQFDTPTDASGHIKTALAGADAVIPVENGHIQLGSSQGIFFFEFDGPRRRKFFVTMLAGN